MKEMNMKMRSLVATGVFAVTIAAFGVVFGLGHNNTAQAGACVNSVFRTGSTGTCVKYIQALNNYFATHNAANTLVVDGAYGTKTYNSIYKFQSYWGLSRDGIVGPKTWNILCAPQLGNSADPGRVPASFPIWAAKGAGCPGSGTYHY